MMAQLSKPFLLKGKFTICKHLLLCNDFHYLKCFWDCLIKLFVFRIVICPIKGMILMKMKSGHTLMCIDHMLVSANEKIHFN
jgi:hypothetical protein